MNASNTKALNKPIHVAMIGGGVNSAIGRVHEIAMKLDGCFKLVAGCFSRDSKINVQSASEYNIDLSRTYTSIDELLTKESSDISLVVIASPIRSHYEHISKALAAGYDVISDKPLVANRDEFKSLERLINDVDKKVFCIFNYTGYPAVREIRSQVNKGTIGRLFKISVEMPQDSYLRLKNCGSEHLIQKWRLEDQEIACVTLDLFIHLHSLIHFICEKTLLKLHSSVRSISNVSPGLIDEVDAIIQYEDDLVATAWYGKASLGSRNGLKLRVFGTEGSFEWHQEAPEQLKMADRYGDIRFIDRLSESSMVMNEPRYQRFKAGHPAGFIEAFANYYFDIYRAIVLSQSSENLIDFHTVGEGIRAAHLIHKTS